jgi:ribosome modulation factor
MKCPKCHSEDLHRSRRRGLKEGWSLRRKQLAPYRCSACGNRFIAAEPRPSGQERALSIADYLGLNGRARERCNGTVILGGLSSLLILLSILLFLALALGWIEPESLPRRGP